MADWQFSKQQRLVMHDQQGHPRASLPRSIQSLCILRSVTSIADLPIGLGDEIRMSARRCNAEQSNQEQ